MIQLVCKNKVYFCGKLSEVIVYLKELKAQYATVRELLTEKTETL